MQPKTEHLIKLAIITPPCITLVWFIERFTRRHDGTHKF